MSPSRCLLERDLLEDCDRLRLSRCLLGLDLLARLESLLCSGLSWTLLVIRIPLLPFSRTSLSRGFLSADLSFLFLSRGYSLLPRDDLPLSGLTDWGGVSLGYMTDFSCHILIYLDVVFLVSPLPCTWTNTLTLHERLCTLFLSLFSYLKIKIHSAPLLSFLNPLPSSHWL